MLLPIGHDELRFSIYRPPIVTLAIIVACIVVYGLTSDDLDDQFSPDAMYDYFEATGGNSQKEADLSREQVRELLIKPGVARQYGYVPEGGNLLGLLTHQFLHADLWHLIGNLFFFLMIGISFESLWSRPVYLFAFLFFGVAAALVHGLFTANGVAPMIGASGAISGLIGAFLIRYPKSKIYFLLFFFIRVFYLPIPALVILPLYFVGEVVSGLTDEFGQVAYWAHAGGFAAGACFAVVAKITRLEERVDGGFLDIFRYRLRARKAPSAARTSPQNQAIGGSEEPEQQLPRSSVPPEAAAAMLRSNSGFYELLNVRLGDDYLEGTILINQKINLSAEDASVVILAKLGNFDPGVGEVLLPGIRPTETDTLVLALRLDKKGEDDPVGGKILLMLDRQNPFDDPGGDGASARKIEWMRNAKRMLKMFRVEASVRTPQCSDGRSLKALSGVGELVDLAGPEKSDGTFSR